MGSSMDGDSARGATAVEGSPDWWPYAPEFPHWHVWRGVAGLLYARRPKSSPPKVVRGPIRPRAWFGGPSLFALSEMLPDSDLWRWRLPASFGNHGGSSKAL